MDGDDVGSSLRSAAWVYAAAGGSAARLQQHRARDQAEDSASQPAAPLAASADTQCDEAQASNGEPGGVERAAAEQAAGGHGAGNGRDAQSRAFRTAPRKRDGGGGEGNA